MRRFTRLLQADLKNALGLRFLLAVCLIPAIILLDAIVDLPYALNDPSSISVWYFYFNSIAFGGVYGRYLLGMLCALPYAASFCIERQTEMAPQVMARGGERNYFVSKMMAAAFSGGLTNLMGQALFVALMSARLSLFTPYDFPGMDDFYYMPIAAKLPLAYFAIALYYAFFNGAFLAGLSIWISGFIQSRYAVYTVPAVAIFAQIQIARLFQIPTDWRLDMWLSMRGIARDETTTMVVTPLAVLLLLIASAWSFVKRGKKVMNYA